MNNQWLPLRSFGYMRRPQLDCSTGDRDHPRLLCYEAPSGHTEFLCSDCYRDPEARRTPTGLEVRGKPAA